MNSQIESNQIKNNFRFFYTKSKKSICFWGRLLLLPMLTVVVAVVAVVIVCLAIFFSVLNYICLVQKLNKTMKKNKTTAINTHAPNTILNCHQSNGNISTGLHFILIRWSIFSTTFSLIPREKKMANKNNTLCWRT